jgi:hypothetical protein
MPLNLSVTVAVVGAPVEVSEALAENPDSVAAVSLEVAVSWRLQLTSVAIETIRRMGNRRNFMTLFLSFPMTIRRVDMQPTFGDD